MAKLDTSNAYVRRLEWVQLAEPFEDTPRNIDDELRRFDGMMYNEATKAAILQAVNRWNDLEKINYGNYAEQCEVIFHTNGYEIRYLTPRRPIFVENQHQIRDIEEELGD